MGFLKFQADQIFTGKEMLSGKQVLVCDNAGNIQEIVNERDAGNDIQKLQGILSPGFINCHCHLELSHMKGLIPEKTGLVDFVFSVVTQRHFPEEEILQAINDGEQEMLDNGIVAVGDICNNLTTLSQKLRQRLSYYNFVESSGWLPAVAQPRFQRSFDHYQKFSATLPASLVPHAPYSVSAPLWRLIKPFFAGKVVSIHNQETSFEDELFIQNTGDFVRMYQMMRMDTSFFSPSGKSSLQTYFHQLDGAQKVILVHNTFIREPDLQYIAATRSAEEVFYCLCPNANLYIEDRLPPVDLLRRHGCTLVLGTDSLASNHSLSIWREITTLRRNFPQIGIAEALQWATINGAKALEMSTVLGSFETGKRPGVVLLPNENGQEDESKEPRRLL